MARGVGVALAALFFLALTTPASAATSRKVCQNPPQKIYRDLADNGRLDRKYCAADIDRALHSASLDDYERLGRSGPEADPAPRAPTPAGNERGTLPFSGLDLALFVGVGGPLLLLGASLGRFLRVKPDRELS